MGKVTDAGSRSKRFRIVAELHAAMVDWARQQLPGVDVDWLEAVAKPINHRPRYVRELKVTTKLVAALKDYVALPVPKGPHQNAEALLAYLGPAHIEWLKSLVSNAKRGPQGWSARTALAHAIRLHSDRADLDDLVAASILAGLCAADDDRLQALINEADRGTREYPTAHEGVDVERRRMRLAL